MRVTIDLMKKSTQIIDLSNVINPRVGDDDLLLPLHIIYGDNQTDMRGKDVEFLSNDPNKKNIYIAGTCNTNTPGDNLYTGDLTFRFPAGTFKADGTYDPDKTMFRIVDKETQKVISSVNVKITVMKNNIEFDFDPDNSSYDSRLETMLHDFHDKGQTMLDEIKDLKNQANSNVSGDTATTAKEAKKQADQNAGDISDLKGEVAGARGRFADLPSREDAQDVAINQKESIVNANANYAALQQENTRQNTILANKAGKFELEDKLARLNIQPEMYADLDAVKAAYPNGSVKLIATDDGYLALYRNGQWIKGPVFQAKGIPVQDIPLNAIAYFDSQNIPVWNNTDPKGNLDFSSVTGIQVRGQQSAYFDIEEIMQTFAASPLVTINNQIISGNDFTLIYDNFTHKLSVTNLNGINLDGGQLILWAHYYANNVGLLVDNALEVAYHTYSQTHQFWTAYLAGGYNLDYKIWANDPDLYFQSDVELYSPDEQYEIKRADIIAAAKTATGIVTVDDNNHIHGDTFTIRFNLNTKKVVFKKAMVSLDKNTIVLFLHHYSSVNAGMLVDTDTSILIKNHLQKHPYWAAYLAGGAKLKLVTNDVNPDLFFGGDLEIYSPDQQFEVKRADIIAAAKAASGIVSVDDNNHIHGDTFTIRFNLKTKKLVFKKAMVSLDDNCIVLFLHHYSSVNAGPLMDYYLSQGNVGGSSNSLPSYWQTNVSDAIDRVNTNLGEAGPSGLSFLFITDQHWDGNQKKSAALVHDVMSQTGVQLMANGGDLINQGEKPNMRSAMTSAIESVQYPGVFMATVFGNHDSNWVNVGDQHQYPERQFSHNDVYGYMMSPMVRDQNLVNDFHFVNANQDFTYTFSVKSGDGQVWRWICADTGTDGPVNNTSCQKITELLENSANENIILFAHIWTNNGTKTQFTQDIEKLIDARNGLTSATVSFGTFDFSKSAATSKVIMALGGHEHTDNTWTTTGGVPFILTDSDNADRSESANKQAGTINEQCFDIFTVDPVAKQIKTVRVGRGEDRQFTIK